MWLWKRKWGQLHGFWTSWRGNSWQKCCAGNKFPVLGEFLGLQAFSHSAPAHSHLSNGHSSQMEKKQTVADWLLRHSSCTKSSIKLVPTSWSKLWILSSQPAVQWCGCQPWLSEFRLFACSKRSWKRSHRYDMSAPNLGWQGCVGMPLKAKSDSAKWFNFSKLTNSGQRQQIKELSFISFYWPTLSVPFFTN